MFYTFVYLVSQVFFVIYEGINLFLSGLLGQFAQNKGVTWLPIYHIHMLTYLTPFDRDHRMTLLTPPS